MGGESAAVAAHAAAIAKAVKASGVIVNMTPENFMTILTRADHPIVVVAKGGFFRKSIQYLTAYKGLAFFTKSSDPLILPASVEVVAAESIWIPG
jgi:hypothetical protein